MIDLDKTCLDEVRRILRDHVPECEVRVFGSRVDGTARRYSDLDLALVDAKKLDSRRLARLKEAFSRSNLPILVDVLDWSVTSPEFRKVIEKRYEVLQ
ncbi:nucleotidyltransferase family protein [Trichloromonas sp.]|uniref:nucleotidyltransferase family protein n=1 Tax=Trichloromonas sp. TaxID=3069249 RepID=UPI003D81C123